LDRRIMCSSTVRTLLYETESGPHDSLDSQYVPAFDRRNILESPDF
jgi:hypothetical protein